MATTDSQSSDLTDLVQKTFSGRTDRAEKLLKFFAEQDATTPDEARAIPDSHWSTLPGALVGLMRAALATGQSAPPPSSPPTPTPTNITVTLAAPTRPDFAATLRELAPFSRKSPPPEDLLARVRDLAPAALLLADGDVKALFDADRTARIDATLSWMAAGAPDPVGAFVGREGLRVFALSSAFGGTREVDPTDGSVLVDGFNSRLGLDWKGVGEELRLFARWLVTRYTGAKPYASLPQLVEELRPAGILEGGDPLLRAGQRPIFAHAMRLYRAALADDAALRGVLLGEVYPPKSTPRARRQDGLDSLEPPPDLNVPWRMPRGHEGPGIAAPDPKLEGSDLGALRRILEKLFSSPARIQLLAKDAGLRVERIDFSGPITTVCFNVLEGAVRDGKLGALVRTALDEYPHHAELAAFAARTGLR